ncbi:MAG: hypothetical protein KW806_03270 [Candidatus Yanofskybacteria bacterium]|nr:hypothetical protein [Candidatus Yanofskybacteria bacterium]
MKRDQRPDDLDDELAIADSQGDLEVNKRNKYLALGLLITGILILGFTFKARLS